MRLSACPGRSGPRLEQLAQDPGHARAVAPHGGGEERPRHEREDPEHEDVRRNGTSLPAHHRGGEHGREGATHHHGHEEATCQGRADQEVDTAAARSGLDPAARCDGGPPPPEGADPEQATLDGPLEELARGRLLAPEASGLRPRREARLHVARRERREERDRVPGKEDHRPTLDQNRPSSRYVPNTFRKTSQISPSEAYAFTASMTGGMRFTPSMAARSTPASVSATRAALRDAFTARRRSTWERATASSMRRIGMGSSSSVLKAF